LLEYLIESGIPIASSCRAQNICKKCVINNNQFACDYTVSDYQEKLGQKIYIAYL